MGLTTLIYTSLLALGVFSFDAWHHGGEINLEINIPKGYGASETSITDTVAENLFLNEIADIDAVPTFVVKPRVRSTNEHTVVSMIGDMLGLKKMTLLIQRATGLEPLVINGSVTKRNDRYQLVLVSNPEAGANQRLIQTIETSPGEPVVQMIRRAAPQAMLSYQDYLVCLYLVGKATSGDLKTYEASFEKPGFEGLDLLIQQRMLLQPTGLAGIEASDNINERQAMFTNLRGMLALAQNDDKKAASLFEEALKIRSSFSIAALNLAFMRVHQDRYQDAIELVSALIKSGNLDGSPMMLGPAYTTWGVAAWGLGKQDEAAALFNTANVVNPRATLANLYWGEMLNRQGNTIEAAAKRKLALDNSKYFSPYAETAILFYRLTPDSNAALTKL